MKNLYGVKVVVALLLVHQEKCKQKLFTKRVRIRLKKFKFHHVADAEKRKQYIAERVSDTAYKINEDDYRNVSDVQFFLDVNAWIVDEILED